MLVVSAICLVGCNKEEELAQDTMSYNQDFNIQEELNQDAGYLDFISNEDSQDQEEDDLTDDGKASVSLWKFRQMSSIVSAMFNECTVDVDDRNNNTVWLNHDIGCNNGVGTFDGWNNQVFTIHQMDLRYATNQWQANNGRVNTSKLSNINLSSGSHIAYIHNRNNGAIWVLGRVRYSRSGASNPNAKHWSSWKRFRIDSF